MIFFTMAVKIVRAGYRGFAEAGRRRSVPHHRARPGHSGNRYYGLLYLILPSASRNLGTTRTPGSATELGSVQEYAKGVTLHSIGEIAGAG